VVVPSTPIFYNLTNCPASSGAEFQLLQRNLWFDPAIHGFWISKWLTHRSLYFQFNWGWQIEILLFRFPVAQIFRCEWWGSHQTTLVLFDNLFGLTITEEAHNTTILSSCYSRLTVRDWLHAQNSCSCSCSINGMERGWNWICPLALRIVQCWVRVKDVLSRETLFSQIIWTCQDRPMVLTWGKSTPASRGVAVCFNLFNYSEQGNGLEWYH